MPLPAPVTDVVGPAGRGMAALAAQRGTLARLGQSFRSVWDLLLVLFEELLHRYEKNLSSKNLQGSSSKGI